jgi:hypothetical protein
LTTSVATSQPAWLAGCTYDASSGNDLRNSTVTAMYYDPGPSGTGGTIAPLSGVLGGAGLLVHTGSGMTITVDPGHFAVANSTPTAGLYASTLASAATLTVATADPTNPRIDRVVAVVTDNGDDTSSGAVKLVTGTAAASPVAPSAPATSITLATIAVSAGATSITSGNITDTRTYTVAVGGVLPAPKGTVNGYLGQLAYDRPSGSFYHNTNSGGVSTPRQARTLPFAPVMAYLTGGAYSLTTSSALIPGLTANVTCDGQTDLKISYKVTGFTGISSETCVITVGCYIDGVLVDETLSPVLTASTIAQGGLNGVGYTNSAFSNTPSAGSHTVTVQAFATVIASGEPTVHPFTGVPASAWMRVEPVNL